MQQVWGGAQELAFPAGSQALLLQLPPPQDPTLRTAALSAGTQKGTVASSVPVNHLSPNYLGLMVMGLQGRGLRCEPEPPFLPAGEVQRPLGRAHGSGLSCAVEGGPGGSCLRGLAESLAGGASHRRWT